MSEFSNNNKIRVDKLTNYMIGLINKNKGSELVEKYEILSTKFTPEDILITFENLFNQNIQIEEIKTASNKLFNILFNFFSESISYEPKEKSIIWHLIDDNNKAKNILNDSKKHIKSLNNNASEEDKIEIRKGFEKLKKFTVHYTFKENILFPILEKRWQNHQCLKLMWSFHDDIRRNISKTIEILQSNDFDLKKFNKIISKVFFNINTIIFREEKILFPMMLKTIDETEFLETLNQSDDVNLYFSPIFFKKEDIKKTEMTQNHVKLSTGEVTLEQLELIFNHLPVDITYVDENNEVRYFSSPKERIFPRTKAIIGRKVQNCHPPESVDVVNKIVESFKNGEKDEANFWLKLGKKYVLIRYFAVRNEKDEYKGVLEVSQEIQDIQKIEGERKLLDW